MRTMEGIDLKPRPARTRPDLTLLIMMATLSVLGLVMILTSSAPRLEAEGVERTSQMVRQALFVAVGVVGLVVASLVSDRSWRMLAPAAYVGGMLLLLLTLSPLGVTRQGAQRWVSFGIVDFQPAELAKPLVILALAALLTAGEDGRIRWSRIGKAVALVGAPAALIFLQPDLGTVLVFAFVTFVMLFIAGATPRQLVILAVGALLLVLFVIESGVLKDYQVDRLAGFLNPGEQTLHVNYNQNQSQIAIGAGGLFGTGLGEGSQTNLAFVPAQTTDFIFTALAEQLGFVGGTLVLGMYALMIWRILMVAANARDRFGQLTAAGIAGMIGIHVFINVGMAVGLLPVTGLPLPFMSFGGSFYLGMAISIGIVNAIWMNRSKVPGERQLF